MTHLSLFSGIGGLDIAAEGAGFETVGQCEWADYPRAVLEKHWPGLPRWRDIRTLTKESFYEQTGLQSVTVLSGGFPCQPFSTAGKRRGKEDDRYLWPEMLRVIQEIRPRWVVGENVAGIVSMELDTVLSDLEKIGYTCQAFIIPACAVDAPHRRDRCAIVAYSVCHRSQTGVTTSSRGEERITDKPIYGGSFMADTQCIGLRKNGNKSYSNIKRDNKTPEQNGGQSYARLDAVAAMFPTPIASDYKNRGCLDSRKNRQCQLQTTIGGQLNPDWVEWLMGFPVGWTSLPESQECAPE